MLTILAVAALCGVLVPDGGKISASPEVDRLTERMGGERWEERRQAFYDLLTLGDDNARSGGAIEVKSRLSDLIDKRADDERAIKRALIQTLDVENSHVSEQSDLSGDYTDYYGDLITAVTSLKDPESVDALAGALGSGTMVVRTLVELGDASVDPVLERLSSGGAKSVTFSCCMALRLMARSSNPNPISDPKLANRVKRALARKPCKR